MQFERGLLPPRERSLRQAACKCRARTTFWGPLLTSFLTTLHNALSEERSDASEIAAGPHRHIHTVVQECRSCFEVLAQVARCEFQNYHHRVTGLTSGNELP